MRSKEQRLVRISKAVEDFGGYLHEYRLAHNLSLQEMSEIVGCSASYIWRIEKYKRFPEMDTRLRMLLALWSMEEIYMYLREIVTRERKAN
ncbi:hypothetical protein HMPREF1012_02308 [Bacillus sp. BT1B_CT2]|uniref:helix-turn-helix domain-containing protein n=1 Tax=Bacillus TaxID=1386 RepID=UPI0001F44648|nr:MULTISPECIES: helix-turn-helix transcriptional regulator [Bacillus]EFV71669.1 hypothetical protein HMPREF1012_02308 [Bacillus sp. BT1B_CT2]MEC3835426.1 helix-turn-helix transcriptional regulator [Bacillus licheniformis]